MINLFEYQNKVSYAGTFSSDDLIEIEQYLDDIWSNRTKSEWYGLDNENDANDENIKSQRFIQILRKHKHFISNKFVGVIKYGDHTINLLPKIFHEKGTDTSAIDLKKIHLHLLWWLSYNSKIKFPSFESGLSSIDSDFFEILIFLFSQYTRELLSSSIFQQYQQVDRELSFVKGAVDINSYINNNLSRGNWHKISCSYDSFEIDNAFNRIIKYVSKLLLSSTKNNDNQNYLREIIFILDEVSDEVVSAKDCQRIIFNPMFAEFEKVRDYCQLFLDHSMSFEYKKDLKLFAFLLPMETIFEDFIFGFIDKEVHGITTGRSIRYLTEDNNFKLKPDNILRLSNKQVIADTKYKLLNNNPKKKWGISQGDMYQMVSYAIRFDIKEVMLIYPKSLSQSNFTNHEFTILDELSGQQIIIKTELINIIDLEILTEGVSLQETFAALKLYLIAKFESWDKATQSG